LLATGAGAATGRSGAQATTSEAAATSSSNLMIMMSYLTLESYSIAPRISPSAPKKRKKNRVLERAWDRAHALELIRSGVGNSMRETFHSALAMGG
jgi:hypothetical protein